MLGDPRIFDLRDARAYVEVPAGAYPYGHEGERVAIESPFWLGRYPVTNSQYRAFVEEGGYSNQKWWSDDGWSWRQDREVAEPRDWHNRRWNGPNQPVVGVSFFEAAACSARAGGCLPREQEWEAAARGPDGCEYPWCGDWEDGFCNTQEAGLCVTPPAGLFPRSRRRLLDLHDLAGNVQEWCKASPESSEDPGVRCGGPWNGYLRGARGASRDLCRPDVRDDDLGFRVVCSSPIKGH